ncbi:hypothetical protein A2188_01435 [Candidatus Woesebacteria bacterium RIFOXYA1_FULL_43_9]|uniref:Antitoxin n=1 Tax=Candidatus Woesebacteria bacterium RIFOXYA1_FULL_43_9 TaxID=1802534 RepID=A0A1F8CLN8_9BACT|nr:MAG: hypothetical protein A2188_01435 [Candidatus Woesebacteria bacterium RIFOXYA1_FULL_43_9]
MNLITTTELRTKTTNLIAMLLAGKEVNLIHRSQIIGVMIPSDNSTHTPANPEILAQTLKAFEPNKKMLYGPLMKKYDQYLKKRHGQSLP